jgi:hypothetical protein
MYCQHKNNIYSLLTARYSLLTARFNNIVYLILLCFAEEGVVSVHNVATKENGDFDEIFGTATAPDPDFPGELEVSFPGSKYKDDFLL